MGGRRRKKFFKSASEQRTESLEKQVGIPTKARAGFSLEGWFLRGRPLQGFGEHFRQDLTGLNTIRQN